MAVLFYKSNWEAGNLPFGDFCAKCREDGFSGIEVFLTARQETAEGIRRACSDHGLPLLAQVITRGDSAVAHRESLFRQLDFASDCGTAGINCHLGSDFFTFEENVGLFGDAMDWSRGSGTPVFFETHRGRALFNLPDTLRYLKVLPDLELTADISHFMCVHESDLSNRVELLDKLVPRCRHIHARIGFEQGPQVVHPLAPEWGKLCGLYLDFWKKIITCQKRDVVVVPEAGPPPYMPVVPFSRAPLADAWQVNCGVRNWLAGELG